MAVKRSHNEILQATAGISMERAVRHILAVFDRATAANMSDGADWYGDAGSIVADMSAASGLTREQCAAVVAHTSPRTTWARNLSVAWAIVMTAGAGYDAAFAAGRAAGGMGGNVDRAVRSLAASDPIATLNGPKTNRFARNILGDRSAVTVDVWAVRIALTPEWSRGSDLDPEKILSRAGVYAAVEHAYRLAAGRRGVDPTTMQAASWIVIRNGRAA